MPRIGKDVRELPEGLRERIESKVGQNTVRDFARATSCDTKEC